MSLSEATSESILSTSKSGSSNLSVSHSQRDGLAHLHQLLILQVGKLIVERAKQKHGCCQALLAVDDLQPTRVVLEGDYKAQEALVVAVEAVAVIAGQGEGEGEQIIPEGSALDLASGVGTLVIGDEEVTPLAGEQFPDCFLRVTRTSADNWRQ